MATSYQSKSKNKPTGQLPKAVRDRMEAERLRIINKAKREKARKEDEAASSTPLKRMGSYVKPGTKPDRDRKAQANRAKSPGGRSFAQTGTTKAGSTLARAAKTKRDITAKITAAEKTAKPAAKSSAKTAKTTPAKTWKDYSSIAAAKAAGSLYYSKGGKKMAAVTKADLDKSGLSLRDYLNYKTSKTRKAAAKKTTAPKKAAPKKGVSTYDEVKPQKGRKPAAKSSTSSKTKARNLTLRDKGGISAIRNAKGPLARARKEYPMKRK